MPSTAFGTSSDWNKTLRDYYDNYDPVAASRKGPSIYDALPTISESTTSRPTTSRHQSKGRDISRYDSRASSRYDSSSHQDDYGSSLKRTGAHSRAHGRTTRDWGPTNSDMDIRSTYNRDAGRDSSTFDSSRGPRRHDSSATTIGRKESRQFDPGVDIGTYGGSVYSRDSASTMRRSHTTHHSKNSSGRESVYDVDLGTFGGGVYGRDSGSTMKRSHTTNHSKNSSGRESVYDVDLSTYGGGFYGRDSGSAMKRSRTAHYSKNSSGRESVYDMDLTSLTGGVYRSSTSSRGRDTSYVGRDSSSFAARMDRSTSYHSGKSAGPGSYGYGSYGSCF